MARADDRKTMIPASLRLAPIAVSAAAYLTAYRASSRLVGPSEARARRWLQRWSRATCRRLGLSLSVEGTPPDTPCVYVSNHRSYLDVPVLSAAVGATFLSRDDIRDWPVVGAAASAIGTVFVDRSDTRGRAAAARALWRRAQHTSIVVFAEGTTCGTPGPGAFQPGLFRLLQHLRHDVVPVTIRYGSRAAYWVDDIPVGEHLRRRVLAGGRLRAVVHLGRPISTTASPDALARAVHAAVSRPIEEYGELVHLR